MILTAAHCMDSGFVESSSDQNQDEFKSGFSQPNPVAYIGASRVDINDPDAEVVPTCTTIVHSGWNGKLLGGFDIALLKLQWASKKTPCSIFNGTLADGQKLTALGWGASETEAYLPNLQKVDTLEFESLEECNSEGKWFGNIKPGMVCADGPTGGDTCDGDSGGPLLLEGKGTGEDQVVGITSFGHVEGCGKPGLPGVYTNISHHIDWVVKEGAGQSRVFQVPFCGNANPETGDPADDIAAKIANDQTGEAVQAIAKSASAEDIAAIEEAINRVSQVGQGEKAVKTLVEAVDGEAINSSVAIPLIAQASKQLPAADTEILSGGGVKSDIFDKIVLQLKDRDVVGAAASIVEAVTNGRSQDVLSAVSAALRNNLDESTDEALSMAVSKGANHSVLATILAPICGEDPSCCFRLAGLGRPGWRIESISPDDELALEDLP
ncbi:hypothetical protein BSKO_00729 [Bryopsis sp. KO-2023]|nr:hypothetical protein BSKO_00729 [Bryopsis sp. KO-2023]